MVALFCTLYKGLTEYEKIYFKPTLLAYAIGLWLAVNFYQ
jgi:hypothetical protein